MFRYLNILQFALLSLLRRPGKYFMLVAVYAVVVGFFASVVFFTAALRQETSVTLADVPEIWIQKLAGGRLIPIESSFVDSLGSIRGVKGVYPRVWGYQFDVATGAVFTVTGSDTTLSGLGLLEVNFEGALDSTMVLCGTGYLEMRGLRVGERLALQDSQGELRLFTIAGTFNSASDLISKDLLVLATAQARQILGLAPNQFTDLGIRVHNPAEVENIARKLDQRFGGIRVVTRAQLMATYQALFGWRGGIFIYGAIVSILAFLILAWDRAAGLNSEEKKELGILKAIGWDISDVLWLKFWEGATVSLMATLLGILMALVHVSVFQAPLLKPFLIGWSVLYPSYDLFYSPGIGDFLAIFSIAVIPYLAATLIPAWYGAITDPASAMQG